MADHHGWQWSGWRRVHATGDVGEWGKMVGDRLVSKLVHSPVTDNAALRDERKANALQSVLEEEADDILADLSRDNPVMVKYITIEPRHPEHAPAAEIMEVVINMEMNNPAVRDQLLREAVNLALRDALSPGDLIEVEPPPA